MHELLKFCEAQRDWLLETIVTLVELESPTSDKAASDRCGRALESLLAAAGGRVRRLPQAAVGDHLVAEFGQGDEQVLILGHLDTVWPVGTLERMPVRVEDGRLHGPGVFDMKAGIAASVLATRALFETGPPPGHRIVMFWSADEETGSATSRAAIGAEARRSRAVFVPEPSLPGGGLKTSRKGGGEFELVVHGVAAHAGVDPGRGASAVHEIARQIAALERLQDLDRGISVNVGTVEGGTRPNVVAEHARARIDVRVPTRAAAARVEAEIRALRPAMPGTRIEVRGGITRPPLERTAAVAALYRLAREVAAGLGEELAEGSSGGGSDGNFTAALGVPTLDGLGPIGLGPHALHEHVEIAPLPWRAALIAGLLQRSPGLHYESTGVLSSES